MSLRHVILAALSQRPLTGYEITKEFDLALGYFWHATHQQVYRELRSMADDGLVDLESVTQSGKPDRKLYQVTGPGRVELDRWLREPIIGRGSKNLLLVKVYASEDVEVIRRHIDDFRQECAASLETYRNISRRYYDEPIAEMAFWKRRSFLTLRFGIAQREAQLAWADEAEAALLDPN